MRTMNTNKLAFENTIADYEKRIAVELERAYAHSQGKQEQMGRALAQSKEKYQSATDRLKELQDQRKLKLEEMREAEKLGKDVERECSEAKRAVQTAEEMIRQTQQKSNDNLAPFGQNIQQVIKTLSSMRWHGDTPIGPLGLYVKVKDPRWAEILRTQLGRQLCSFAITDGRDRATLKQVLTKSGKLVCVFNSSGSNS